MRGLRRQRAPSTSDARTEAHHEPSRGPRPSHPLRCTHCRVYHILRWECGEPGSGLTCGRVFHVEPCDGTRRHEAGCGLRTADTWRLPQRRVPKRDTGAGEPDYSGERQTSSPLSPRGGPDHIDAGHRGRDSERCKLAVTLAGRPSTSMRGSSPTGWTTPMPLVETVSRETWTAVGRRCSLWVATRHDPRSEPLRCCQHQTRRDSCGQLANNPQASNR